MPSTVQAATISSPKENIKERRSALKDQVEALQGIPTEDEQRDQLKYIYIRKHRFKLLIEVVDLKIKKHKQKNELDKLKASSSSNEVSFQDTDNHSASKMFIVGSISLIIGIVLGFLLKGHKSKKSKSTKNPKFARRS